MLSQVNDLEEVFRGNPQGSDEPVLDGARHPAEPSLVVLAFEDVDLGDGHFDLLSCHHSRTTAELLMTLQTSADAGRFHETL